VAAMAAMRLSHHGDVNGFFVVYDAYEHRKTQKENADWPNTKRKFMS
jgi:hypothetical protein